MNKSRIIGTRRSQRPQSRRLSIEHLEERQVLTSGPLISEFMASNTNTLLDIDGDAEDWIELHNPTAAAIDLTGWHLTDDESDLAKWTLPAVTLNAGEFLVLFASGKDRANPAAELHTNFKLASFGEYLALVEPSLTVAHAYAPYPSQVDDIAFGVIFDGFQFVQDGSAVEYHVPQDGSLGTTWTDPAFAIDEESWADGESGVGFGLSVPGFTVTYYKSTSAVGSLDDAENVVANTNLQAATATEIASVINYHDTGGGAHYGSDNPFPSLSIGSAVDDFVVEAFGTVIIPSTGSWTFGVNSDDGFELELTNGTSNFSTSFPNPRGPGDTLQTFNVTQAGAYDARLIMYERGGGAEVELFAAQGSFSSWNGTNFDLVGDVGRGGLEVFTSPDGGGGTAGGVRTDIESAMRGINSSVYVRAPFQVTDPAELDSLSWEVKYNDGFVAYLNGSEIARRNAPPVAAWNSSATTSRSQEDTLTPEVINLTSSLNLLTAGVNVLSIHGLNVTANHENFLLAPTLIGGGVLASDPLYFADPTPGSINSAESFGIVADTTFSVDRGFYDAQFQVEITSATPDATIRYTSDGSEPTSTTGSIYNGPITISTTTSLRAAAFKPGFQATNVDTQTYVFVDDVINQPSNPAGFPSSWGGEPADYAMDTDVTGNPLFNDSLQSDLKSLPVMSIVLDQADMFGSSGIYSNPNNQGTAWERPASIEYFTPDGSEEFQENAGIRMYGGVGRNAQFKKHSFRLLFKSQYGDTKLRHPLFGDDAVDRFDTIILRSNFNDAWVWGGSASQFVRDEFAGRLQNAMGEPGRHGNFVHLYINGLYWGLYNPVERPDTSFSASYFGGEKENWDGINSGSPTGESQTAGWNTLMSMSGGLGSNSEYQRVQGNNVDGTNNPAYEDYLDIDNYITYLLLNFWAGNNDWVTHNWYAGRERGPNSTGFKSYSWDAEWIVDLRSGLNDNSVNDTTTNNHLLKPYTYLRNNAEFRLRFADQIHEHFFNGGVLTPNKTTDLYQSLVDEIEAAVVTESARWGDVAQASPFTPTDWANERDYVLNTYLPQRTSIVLQQLRSAGLYPDVAAPTLAINGISQHGGEIQVGDSLTISGGGGTIYYTIDGTDPRALYGGVSATADAYAGAIPLNEAVNVQARTLSNGEWSALTNATFLLETPPPIRITEIMYNPSAADVGAGELNVDNDLYEYIEIENVGSQALDIDDLRFTNGVDFDFAGSNVTSLAAGDRVLVVSNIAAFQSRYGTGVPIAGEFANATNLSNSGERIRLESAVGQVFHDFSYSDGWYPQTDGSGFSLTILDANGPLGDWDTESGWRSSDGFNGSPGTTDTGIIPGTIVINELLTHTDAASGDWIELVNTSGSAVDLSGWFLSDDRADLTKYQLASGTVIAAGDYLVFTQTDNFGNAGDPGTNTVFGFSELGDEAILSSLDPATGGPGGYRADVDYAAAEKEVTFGRVVNSAGYVDFVSMTANTQSTSNAPPIVPDVVINEIMYHPALPDTSDDEYIELFNRGSVPVSLFDPVRPANTWRFTNGIEFDFPQDVTLGAGEYVLVVPVEPVAFRDKHNVPAQVRIFGPYIGNLANTGEVLELSRPGDPDPGTTEVPYIVNERVRFNDKLPWPFTPDGAGPSLSRAEQDAWGNEPLHWSAGTNGGTPGVSNLFTDSTPPSVPTNLDLSVAPSGLLQVSWAPASDAESGVSSYRVFRDGGLIGTSVTTSITDVSANFDSPHAYTVSAVNGDGIEGMQSSAVSTQVRSFQNGAAPDGSYAGTTDTELRGANPTSNQGTDTNMEIDGDDGGSDLWVLLKWELSGVPANATILGASITLNVTNSSNGSYEAYAMKRDWVESEATWQQFQAGQSWQSDGGQGTNDRGTSPLGTMNFNSTGLRTFNLNGDGLELLQDWLRGTTSNNGFILGNTATTDGLDFNSSEVTSASNRPRLSVSYVVSSDNDPPSIANQSFSTNENRPNGTVVGTVAASDPNAGDDLTFDVTGGTGAGAFAVNTTSGAITVADNSLVNHESAASLNLNVRVTDDGGLSDSAVVTIQINDVNEAPALVIQALNVDEDADNGDGVGTITANDPDAGETLSFQLSGGTGVGVFNVAENGTVTVLDSNSLDFETQLSFTLTVRVTDSGGLTDVETFTVGINDVNEAPRISDVPTLSIPEHSDVGTIVGVLDVVDADAGDSVQFEIIGGTGATAFSIASDGTILVDDASQLDFEISSGLSLTVRVVDAGGLSDTRTFTVSITDVTESLADFDANRLLNCGDVDDLVDHIVQGDDDPIYDLTVDGVVDRGDLGEWLVLAGAENLPAGRTYSSGDVNLDGVVDAQDFEVWSANRFTTLAAFCSGDLNADGAIDGSDFNIWQANKFQQAPAGAHAAKRVPRAAAVARDAAVVEPAPHRMRDIVRRQGRVSFDLETRRDVISDYGSMNVDRVFARYERRSLPKEPSEARDVSDLTVLDALHADEWRARG